MACSWTIQQDRWTWLSYSLWVTSSFLTLLWRKYKMCWVMIPLFGFYYKILCYPLSTNPKFNTSSMFPQCSLTLYHVDLLNCSVANLWCCLCLICLQSVLLRETHFVFGFKLLLKRMQMIQGNLTFSHWLVSEKRKKNNNKKNTN